MLHLERMIVVGIRKRVEAFEPPLRERRAVRSLRRAARQHLESSWDRSHPVRCGSVAVQDPESFRFLSFLLAGGSSAYPDEMKTLVHWLGRFCANKTVATGLFDQWEDEDSCYVAARTQDKTRMLVLLTYRPRDVLPLCMASARRAVSFVHAVVALVTANAYISTLGGGHFLCRHLDRSTLLAKLQIGISMGLHDPILESKCRVNLAYNALQLGRFRRAKRILRHEEMVAEQLDSKELRKVCHAANVYLNKLYNLHKEQMLFQRSGASSDGRHAPHLHDNFYRQRIVRLTK